LTALLVSPVTAQKGFDLSRDKFDTNQCSRLAVFDVDGETRLILSTDEHGGIVAVNGKGNRVAGMGITERGDGVVTTLDKNGYQQ